MSLLQEKEREILVAVREYGALAIKESGPTSHYPPGLVLPVPYSSQHERDAKKFRLDCGPACIEMVGEYFVPRSTITTDYIHQWITGGKDRGTYGHELVKALDALYGVRAERLTTDFAQLLVEIDHYHPTIVLVKYGNFPMRMDRNYTGGHWMVVVGYHTFDWAGTPVTRLIMHDPDWYNDDMPQGALLPVSKEMFTRMYSGVSVVAYSLP